MTVLALDTRVKSVWEQLDYLTVPVNRSLKGNIMTRRQGVPIHTLPGNILASTLGYLSQGGWTDSHAEALRRMGKNELQALGLLLEDRAGLKKVLEEYLGKNFFASGKERVVYAGSVTNEDTNEWDLGRRGLCLEVFSKRTEFQLKDLELVSMYSGKPENLLSVIEMRRLRLVPYTVMYALWKDLIQHEVDHSGVIVELVKTTKNPVERIFCGQKVSVGMALGYLCIEDLVCETRKPENSMTMEGDFLLVWK